MKSIYYYCFFFTLLAGILNSTLTAGLPSSWGMVDYSIYQPPTSIVYNPYQYPRITSGIIFTSMCMMCVWVGCLFLIKKRKNWMMGIICWILYFLLQVWQAAWPYNPVVTVQYCLPLFLLGCGMLCLAYLGFLVSNGQSIVMSKKKRTRYAGFGASILWLVVWGFILFVMQVSSISTSTSSNTSIIQTPTIVSGKLDGTTLVTKLEPGGPSRLNSLNTKNEKKTFDALAASTDALAASTDALAASTDALAASTIGLDTCFGYACSSIVTDGIASMTNGNLNHVGSIQSHSLATQFITTQSFTTESFTTESFTTESFTTESLTTESLTSSTITDGTASLTQGTLTGNQIRLSDPSYSTAQLIMTAEDSSDAVTMTPQVFKISDGFSGVTIRSGNINTSPIAGGAIIGNLLGIYDELGGTAFGMTASGLIGAPTITANDLIWSPKIQSSTFSDLTLSLNQGSLTSAHLISSSTLTDGTSSLFRGSLSTNSVSFSTNLTPPSGATNGIANFYWGSFISINYSVSPVSPGECVTALVNLMTVAHGLFPNLGVVWTPLATVTNIDEQYKLVNATSSEPFLVGITGCNTSPTETVNSGGLIPVTAFVVVPSVPLF